MSSSVSQQAALSPLKQFIYLLFSSKGKINRTQFLIGLLCIIFSIIVLIWGDKTYASFNKGKPLLLLLGIIIFVMIFMLSIKRLRDIGRFSGLSLCMLLPYLNLIFALYLLLTPGQKGELPLERVEKISVQARTTQPMGSGSEQVQPTIDSIAQSPATNSKVLLSCEENLLKPCLCLYAMYYVFYAILSVPVATLLAGWFGPAFGHPAVWTVVVISLTNEHLLRFYKKHNPHQMISQKFRRQLINYTALVMTIFLFILTIIYFYILFKFSDSTNDEILKELIEITTKPGQVILISLATFGSLFFTMLIVQTIALSKYALKRR